MTKLEEKSPQDYPFTMSINTRWMDNDVYGHVNNVTYYSYFDTVVNHYLIEHAGLDIHADKVVGFVVASSCEYHAPISFPEPIIAALTVNKIGNKSIEYGVAIFKHDDSTVCATGSFTHVFVDRERGCSVAIPTTIRSALNKLN